MGPSHHDTPPRPRIRPHARLKPFVQGTRATRANHGVIHALATKRTGRSALVTTYAAANLRHVSVLLACIRLSRLSTYSMTTRTAPF